MSPKGARKERENFSLTVNIYMERSKPDDKDLTLTLVRSVRRIASDRLYIKQISIELKKEANTSVA